MNAGRSRELKKTKIEIIPMIDTMFFLLVFFILSSLGVVKLQGINVNLPKTAPTTPTKSDKPPIDLTVAINAQGQISVNKEVVPQGRNIGPILRRKYRQQAERGAALSDAAITISADYSVPQGTVVRCIDEARSVNINKIAFATPPSIPTFGAPTPSTTIAPPGPPQ